MNSNKALKYIYNKLYNNGKFIKLIVNMSDIKKLNNYYKNNFDKYENNFYNFINEMGSLKNKLIQSNAALLEFQKQFHQQKGLQPAIITECFISQTIADFLNLENFVDTDEKEEKIPAHLLLKIISFNRKKEITIPRYIYYNEDSTIILLQYGNSPSIDAIFIKEKDSVRIEFKEQKSKLEEIDITKYDENGLLIIDNDFQTKYTEYIKYIELFNDKTTIFETIAHNFKLINYLSEENINKITEKVFDTKIIDLFMLQEKKFIYPVLPKNLTDNIDFSGSEIRTAGRNPKKLFTPNYAKKVIKSLNGSINENQIIKLPYNKKSISIGRTISKPTRYKINNLLFVKIENIKINDNFIYFSFKNIQQLKPSIALHLDVKINKITLAKSFLYLNNKK